MKPLIQRRRDNRKVTGGAPDRYAGGYKILAAFADGWGRLRVESKTTGRRAVMLAGLLAELDSRPAPTCAAPSNRAARLQAPTPPCLPCPPLPCPHLIFLPLLPSGPAPLAPLITARPFPPVPAAAAAPAAERPPAVLPAPTPVAKSHAAAGAVPGAGRMGRREVGSRARAGEALARDTPLRWNSGGWGTAQTACRHHTEQHCTALHHIAEHKKPLLKWQPSTNCSTSTAPSLQARRGTTGPWVVALGRQAGTNPAPLCALPACPCPCPTPPAALPTLPAHLSLPKSGPRRSKSRRSRSRR